MQRAAGPGHGDVTEQVEPAIVACAPPPDTTGEGLHAPKQVQLFCILKATVSLIHFQVAYFGDSMHSDIFSAHHYNNWETVLILEELTGGCAMMTAEMESEPLEKKGKYEGRHAKALNSVSKQWGSFFVNTISRKEGMEETLVKTWSCKCISAYSTIAIPSIEAIAEALG
ncbi:5'-nucleotidase domain-containing protein 1 [Varanus komodoensis]|nr:5'-nucleotidase domain-containing protein 1 [Varanus komodoensis]